jgi:hypothetical protein
MVRLGFIVALGLASLAAPPLAAQPESGTAQPAAQATVDPATVYRFDPFRRELVATPPEEIKPGYAYFRHHPGMGRHVWSLATADGGFEYVMGVGSVAPARALDLRATPAEMQRQLAEEAPELKRIMDTRGTIAYVRLADERTWTLVPQPTIPSVYDLESLRRWEWHGERRVAVMHTGGFDWLQVDGRFVPASYPVRAWGSCW